MTEGVIDRRMITNNPDTRAPQMLAAKQHIGAEPDRTLCNAADHSPIIEWRVDSGKSRAKV